MTETQFRKKPVVIEAIQYGPYSAPTVELVEFLNRGDRQWGISEDGIIIRTLEGDHLASIGDWIIRGVKGEFYPCKPDIFEATYEPAALPAPSGAKAVEDTWFTDRALPVMAMSGDVEDNRVLRLHFRRPVTDDDRKAMCDALNLHQASLAHPLPAEVGRVLEPFAREAERWEQKGGVYWPDSVPFPANSISGIKIGHLRAARDLLSKTGRTGE